MKVFFFHLMPYADLDQVEANVYNSAWLNLPNRLYEPARGVRLYDRYIRELELADVLGFDGICVNEHHQTAYGLMPAPNLIASALCRSTSTAKIAILGRALPLVSNPIAIAEEFAMLDGLSNGRIITGFVRGIGSEYFASGANPSLSHELFYEAHDLILRAWKEPGPFRHMGKHFHFEYVNPWPRPVQQPHPPVWIPSQGSKETVEWASHPSRKYTYLQTFSPYNVARKAFEYYYERASEHGYEASPSQLGWAVPVYVSVSDERARAEMKPHIEAFFARFLRYPIEMRMPPGYASIASTRFLTEQKFEARQAAQTIEAMIESGLILCGSPSTVRDQIRTAEKELGIGTIIAMLQMATLPADLTDQNLRLFASDVMPHLKSVSNSRSDTGQCSR